MLASRRRKQVSVQSGWGIYPYLREDNLTMRRSIRPKRVPSRLIDSDRDLPLSNDQTGTSQGTSQLPVEQVQPELEEVDNVHEEEVQSELLSVAHPTTQVELARGQPVRQIRGVEGEEENLIDRVRPEVPPPRHPLEDGDGWSQIDRLGGWDNFRDDGRSTTPTQRELDLGLGLCFRESCYDRRRPRAR